MEYPWYQIVSGEDITQGDILHGCPVISLLSSGEGAKVVNSTSPKYRAEKIMVNGIILTQACDLEHGKVENVVVCPILPRSQFERKLHVEKNYKEGSNAILKEVEHIQKGERPGLHLLNCYQPAKKGDLSFEHHIVEFKNLFSVPVNIAREVAVTNGERLRLLPPYREHLSQAFARYFMRVGLPSDIKL